MEDSEVMPSEDVFQSELELETLRSIYVRELDVKHIGSDTTVSIQLHPSTADKLEEQFVRMTLVFSLTKEYPNAIPEICIQNTRGLSDEKIEEIIKTLEEEAEERKGSPMMFELIELAKEYLTADNKPNEECAICLYGFLEGDAFMKTECYHYFHCHCLSRYVESRLRSEEDRDGGSKHSSEEEGSPKKVPCPVCRLEICFSEFGQSFSEPLAVREAPSAVEVQHWNELKELEELFQKQLAQGGIIDLKAEDEKFLLEISSVSNDMPAFVKPAEQNIVVESENVKRKGCSSSEGKYQTLPNSKNSPRKFRYLKSRPKLYKKNTENQQKDSCATEENGEASFQQNTEHNKSSSHYNNVDSLSTSNESHEELEQGDNENSLAVDKQEVSELEGRNDVSCRSSVSQNNYSTKFDCNRSNVRNSYNSRKPFINRFQGKQNNFNSNMSRENNYRKFNASRGSFNSARGSFNSARNFMQNNRDAGSYKKDERNNSFSKDYQNNSNPNRHYYQNERERNGSFQDDKFQGRRENNTYEKNEGSYRNNYRERNNYNNNNGYNYGNRSYNEKQKYRFQDSPQNSRQYQQPKRFPNKHYNQNDYHANNWPKRPYNTEPRNVQQREVESPSKINYENPQNSLHVQKYNRRQQNEVESPSKINYENPQNSLHAQKYNRRQQNEVESSSEIHYEKTQNSLHVQKYNRRQQNEVESPSKINYENPQNLLHAQKYNRRHQNEVGSPSKTNYENPQNSLHVQKYNRRQQNEVESAKINYENPQNSLHGQKYNRREQNEVESAKLNYENPQNSLHGHKYNRREQNEVESAKINYENPQNSLHGQKYNRREQNEHLDHFNKNHNKFEHRDNNVQLNSRSEEKIKKYPKKGHNLLESCNKFAELESEDIFEKLTLNDTSQAINKEIGPNGFQSTVNEVKSTMINAHVGDDVGSLSLPHSLLSNTVPSLPPGFANPSKKVIYGLPSFHCSPPPGFQLS